MSRRTGAPLALALAQTTALVAGCTGDVGTFTISIVTAPESSVMDDVSHARLTLETDPPVVAESDLDADGRLALAIEIPVAGGLALLTFEGFDAGGELIALGRSGPLPLGAQNAAIKIYVAAPLSIAAAPVQLPGGRNDLGVTAVSYGVLLAGGRDGDGDPTDELLIYNVYDHGLDEGDPLPAPRARPSVGFGVLGLAYVYGGEDGDGDPTPDLWAFDTTVAPAGAWAILDSDEAPPRAGASLAPLGNEEFLVVGQPTVLIDGVRQVAEPFPGAPPLAGRAASTEQSGIIFTLIAGEGAGTTGAVRLVGNDFDEEPAPSDVLRTEHGLAAVSDGRMVIAGGAVEGVATRAVIDCDVPNSGYESVPDVLSVGRRGAAVAATAGYLVVAGGVDEDGAVRADADVIDLETMARIATLALAGPRRGAVAAPLANGQILIAGGEDSDGTPVATIELFTPPE